ncbi:hypothetical protein F2Q69_00063340 [Brassica cretica]|uniref:Uncharacterized protein n=1 Tax=Brassica cretica TaxID=69181 RepID=A0A8S9RFX5_BRACR|nr:hypothetical protein F2Q69_00063340 [Brassica cretica]
MFIDEKHLKTNQSLLQWVSSLPEVNQTKPQIGFLRAQGYLIEKHNFAIVVGGNMCLALCFHRGGEKWIRSVFLITVVIGGGDD